MVNPTVHGRRIEITKVSYRGNRRWHKISLYQSFIDGSSFDQDIIPEDGEIRVHITPPHARGGGVRAIRRQRVVHEARLANVGIVKQRPRNLTLVGFAHANERPGRGVVDVTSRDV